jgi:hypothetical protein
MSDPDREAVAVIHPTVDNIYGPTTSVSIITKPILRGVPTEHGKGLGAASFALTWGSVLG